MLSKGWTDRHRLPLLELLSEPKNPELAPEKIHVYLMLFPPLLLGSFLQEMFLRISENSLLNLLDMTEYKIGLRMQLK